VRSTILSSLAIATLVLCIACSSKAGDNTSYKDSVKKALEQAELTDVSVAEDRDMPRPKQPTSPRELRVTELL